jgi:hypothetical protein
MWRLLLLLAIFMLPVPAIAETPPLPRARPKLPDQPAEPRSFAEASTGLNFDFTTVTSQLSVCQKELEAVAVVDPLPRLIGPGECGGGDMVSMRVIFLTDKSPVSINPPLVLQCRMASAFAGFVRNELSSVFRGPRALRSIDGTGSYECRGRNRIVGAKVSEHGKGNAVDIHSVKFADGTSLFPTDLMADKDLRELLRTAACGRFTTVLGPGSDGYHEEHVHVDLAERSGNFKMCQWDVRVPAPSGVVTGLVPLPRPRPSLSDEGPDKEDDSPG